MRVGIFGYGLAARVFHAPLAKLAGFNIVAIQTGNSDRIAQAKSDFPNAAICSSSEELLSQNLDLPKKAMKLGLLWNIASENNQVGK